MSSGTVKTENNKFAARSWTRSITVRLTVLYTLSACAILALAVISLYLVFRNDSAKEDAQFLTDKIHVLRMILRERPDNAEALEEEVKLEGAALQFTRYYARVLDEEGRILLETPGMEAALAPGIFPAPFGVSEGPGSGKVFEFAGGESYLVMSALAQVGRSGGEKRVLQVALDVTHDYALMSSYRRKMALVFSMGILASAWAGFIVARRGMRPLKEMAEAAHAITAAKLHERIEPGRWPEELAALAAAFDGMLDRLEDSFNRLAQSSANMAHELRTPINSLMGTAEVALSKTRSAEEYRQVIESSIEEYERLSRMIESLLFLARAEGRDICIERTLLDASTEVERVSEFYGVLAEEQGVAICCRGNARVNADPVLFRRALSNLLSNALKYTPKGGKIDIRITSSPGHVSIEVSDTGCGIDPADLPRVFDRFYTGHARQIDRHGAGLGLSIVKSIMELHGGDCEIKSRPSGGTTAILRFP